MENLKKTDSQWLITNHGLYKPMLPKYYHWISCDKPERIL